MKRALTSFCAATLLLAVGCAAPVTVNPNGPLRAQKGAVPLLRVTISFEEGSWAGQPGWGGMSQPNPRRVFARLASAAAQETGAMNVPEPRKIKSTISARGEKYTLNPDAKRLKSYLAILEPDAYLTAELKAWQENYYTGLFQDSTLTFTLTCRRPGESEPLWTATVDREENYMSARELARESLEQAFERVMARTEKEGPQ